MSLEKGVEDALRTAGWPPYLVKAVLDPWTYELALHSGLELKFEYAVDLGGGWVRLEGVESRDPKCPRRFERGLDVRLSEIAWVSDCPP